MFGYGSIRPVVQAILEAIHEFDRVLEGGLEQLSEEELRRLARLGDREWDGVDLRDSHWYETAPTPTGFGVQLMYIQYANGSAAKASFENTRQMAKAELVRRGIPDERPEPAPARKTEEAAQVASGQPTNCDTGPKSSPPRQSVEGFVPRPQGPNRKWWQIWK